MHDNEYTPPHTYTPGRLCRPKMSGDSIFTPCQTATFALLDMSPDIYGVDLGSTSTQWSNSHLDTASPNPDRLEIL